MLWKKGVLLFSLPHDLYRTNIGAKGHFVVYQHLYLRMGRRRGEIIKFKSATFINSLNTKETSLQKKKVLMTALRKISTF